MHQFHFICIKMFLDKPFLTKQGANYTHHASRTKSIRESTHIVYVRFIKLYRSNAMHARDNDCVRLCCFPFPYFSVYSGARSLFGVGKSWLPSHPSAVSEMSVYRDTIERKNRSTLRFYASISRNRRRKWH